MAEKMIEKSNQVILSRVDKINAKKMSIHQLMTMSSLIEEEANAKADRKKIASVFYNRIDENMPLQTDPTVLYAQGKHKSRVYEKDLSFVSPYNTYKNKGLPPGPIANVSESSIDAALEPDKTDFLYFLASKQGDIYYSKTLNEHNEKVEKYITNPKNQ